MALSRAVDHVALMTLESCPEPILVFDKVLKSRAGGRGYQLFIEDFKVFPQDRLALIGDSGSGKSTLLDLAALISRPDAANGFFWRPSSGREAVNPRTSKAVDLAAAWKAKKVASFEKIRRLELGYVTQTGGLLPFLSVRDNILLPAQMKKMGSKALSRLIFLVKELKIESLLSKLPSKLSVGQRQRCAIARALVHEPSLILADEPTASLDPPTARQALDLLLRLSQDQALIIATHNWELIKGQGFTVYKVICEAIDPSRPVEARLVRLEA
ncbi:MAG: ABC transporter ATP-binding protein [Deltaproteobacteria bacterium]|jgi:putative ABC transport system ATP-binding protein|nr:ABC transporter ATP-binding protein [Deltaproteobacteria bacterium]